MSTRELRFAIVTSTAGSVMNAILSNEFFRTRVQLVVADHAGLASEKAARHDVSTVVVPEADEGKFCNRLAPLLEEHAIDFVFSFYTQFYSAGIRAAFEDRIINAHPSLLPAFKGADGFGDTIAYGALLAGNTIEFIADVMCPVDGAAPIARTRHRVFVQQCKALLQVAHWLQQGRVTVDDRRVVLDGARFDGATFSPALEDDDVIAFDPPNPFRDGVEAMGAG